MRGVCGGAGRGVQGEVAAEGVVDAGGGGCGGGERGLGGVVCGWDDAEGLERC